MSAVVTLWAATGSAEAMAIATTPHTRIHADDANLFRFIFNPHWMSCLGPIPGHPYIGSTLQKQRPLRAS